MLLATTLLYLLLATQQHDMMPATSQHVAGVEAIATRLLVRAAEDSVLRDLLRLLREALQKERPAYMLRRYDVASYMTCYSCRSANVRLCMKFNL